MLKYSKRPRYHPTIRDAVLVGSWLGEGREPMSSLYINIKTDRVFSEPPEIYERIRKSINIAKRRKSNGNT